MLKLILILLVTSKVYTGEYLIKQGSSELVPNDLYAFAYTIPDDKRVGFFQSNERLTSSLINLLRMKQLIDYGEKDIDKQQYQNRYQNAIADIFENIQSLSVIDESKLIKIKKFIQMKIKSDLVKESLKIKFESEIDLVSITKEHYLLNSDNYRHPDVIDYRFITISFDEGSKSEKVEIAEEYRKKFNNDKSLFAKVVKDYSRFDNIDMAGEIKNNIVQKWREFTQKLVKHGEGLMSQLIIEDGRVFVVEVLKIYPGKQKTFEQAKLEIIESIKPEIINNMYNNFVMELSHGKELEINEEQIANLKISDL